MFEKFRQTMRNRVSTYALSFLPEMYEGAKHSEQRKTLGRRIQRSYVWRIKAEIDTLRTAIQTAESPIRPDRRALLSIYREVEMNSEVLTQTRVSVFTVSRAPFQVVDAKGNPNKEIKKRFEKSWFYDFLELCVHTEFFGFTLMEFDPTKTAAGDFKAINCIPRENVRPEFGDVLLTQSDFSGASFYDSKNFPFLLPMGKPWDLGLFKTVAFPAIRMKYSDSDWSQFSEKFGMPILAIKTASQDKAEIDEKERMAQNLGANGYVILDDTDEIEFMNGNSGAAPHGVFLDRINKAENQIAKLINGQSSTSDEKAHVGSAEVHERILNNFTYARMRSIQFFINEELLPFLTRHGYGLENYEFQFMELLEKQSEDKQPTPTDNKGQSRLEKKKPNVALTIDNEALKLNFDDCCGTKPKTLKLNFDLTALMEQIVLDVYTEKTKTGDLNMELWKENALQVIKGMEKGYGKSYLKTAYSNPDKEVLAQLKHNAMVFTAFKNHANIAEMVKNLRDENGNIRPFSQFKAIAQNISTNYNVHWLAAEYDSAIGAARMAANWNHIKQEQENDGEDVLLKYVTVGDARVRKAHEKLDGVTLPMSNPFWETFYPPNGWRCRCDVEVVYDTPEVDMEEPPSDDEVPPTFRFNPGQTNELFSPEHPYFLIQDKKQRETIIKQMNIFRLNDLVKEDYLVSQKDFAKHFKVTNLAQIGTRTEGNGYIVVHKKHDQQALLQELPACEILANKGHRIVLLNEQVQDVRPDVMLDEKIYDIKQMSNATNVPKRIVEHFRNTYKKANRMILHINQTTTKEDIVAGIKEGARKYENIKEVILIYDNQVRYLDMANNIAL
jgi:SPP1 gp7 family putative phage head morphogenesis protein